MKNAYKLPTPTTFTQLILRTCMLFAFTILFTGVMAQTISIQGVLRDPNGRSVDDGAYSVVFKIYDAGTGGTALWTDTYASLQTNHGVFQANLGENTTLDGLAFDAIYYVGVTVENFAEMTPRLPLTIYPYAKAILGQDNKFPSTGNIVLAKDSIIVQQGALKFEGANGRIVFNDGTSLNTADFGGPASGLLNPSSINLNADKDTLSSGAINFQIAGQTKAIITNGGVLEVGLNTSSRGLINLFGEGTGSSTGGALNFYKALDYNTPGVLWYARVSGDDFYIGNSGGADQFILSNTGASVAGDLVVKKDIYVGEEDAVAGFINLYGSTTGSPTGGRIRLYTAADHDGARDSYEFLVENDYMKLYSNGLDIMYFGSDGNVGIGDFNPSEARLVVRGGVAQGWTLSYFMSPSGHVGPYASNPIGLDLGVYVEKGVGASGFYVVSDERIKEVLNVSNSSEDLSILNKLTITDYKYIDKVIHGDKAEKKLIAQQVKEIYPLAIIERTDFIPNIYATAEKVTFDKEAKSLTIQMKKPHELSIGDEVRILKEDGELEAKVVKVNSQLEFTISTDEALDLVFVYGKRVDDFLNVDYDAIGMLNVSATQELAKLVKQQDEEIKALKAKLAKVDVLEARLNALMGLDKTASTKGEKVAKK